MPMPTQIMQISGTRAMGHAGPGFCMKWVGGGQVEAHGRSADGVPGLDERLDAGADVRLGVGRRQLHPDAGLATGTTGKLNATT